MIRFNHFNFNVLDLEKSIAFYKEALNLTPVREKNAEDGSFKLVYLGDGSSDFTLELTWLKDRTEPYDLGECEFHLAFTTDEFATLAETWRVILVSSADIFQSESLRIHSELYLGENFSPKAKRVREK